MLSVRQSGFVYSATRTLLFSHDKPYMRLASHMACRKAHHCSRRPSERVRKCVKTGLGDEVTHRASAAGKYLAGGNQVLLTPRVFLWISKQRVETKFDHGHRQDRLRSYRPHAWKQRAFWCRVIAATMKPLCTRLEASAKVAGLPFLLIAVAAVAQLRLGDITTRMLCLRRIRTGAGPSPACLYRGKVVATKVGCGRQSRQ